jgi:hypothetical protein
MEDQPTVPNELIKRHYTQMSISILKMHAMEGTPIEIIVRRLVGMFGLIPSEVYQGKYEVIPELRKIADEAAAAGQSPQLPTTFTEDEAVLFCACQTALLEVQGKLQELTDQLQDQATALILKQKANNTAEPIDQVKMPDNVVSLKKKPNGSGPTFH